MNDTMAEEIRSLRDRLLLAEERARCPDCEAVRARTLRLLDKLTLRVARALNRDRETDQ